MPAVPAEPLSTAVAVAVALGPLAWSLLAFAWPGGWWWWQQLGGRALSPREHEALALALEDLTGGALATRGGSFSTTAAVRGTTLMVTRQLLGMPDALRAVLAHELGQLTSPDGRLTEALNRLVLFELRTAEDEGLGLIGAPASSPSPSCTRSGSRSSGPLLPA